MNIRENRGFTLIELMIVVAILMIVGVSLYKTHSQNSIFHKNNIFRQKATWVLQSQAELIRAKPFREIKEVETSPFSDELTDLMGLGDAKGSVTVERVSPELKRVTLGITWRDANQKGQRLSLAMYRCRQ
jgi:prepilin-type N-terminal cleavage/methylation domain-containing protein